MLERCRGISSPEAVDSCEKANEAKAVAGVRYYNMAGQEVAQPNGMTIQVTTYTDGTTTTAKVVK